MEVKERLAFCSECVKIDEMFSENVSDLTFPAWPFQTVTVHVYVTHVTMSTH